MKTFAVLLLAVAAASAEIDWANVKPVMMMDGFWDGRDSKIAASADRNGRIVNGEIAAPHQFPYQVSWLESEDFDYVIHVWRALGCSFDHHGNSWIWTLWWLSHQ